MTVKSLVAFAAFVFFLLCGLMLNSTSFKPVGLFWTDIFGTFLMPLTTAFAGSCFIYVLLFWYEITRYSETRKFDKDL